MAFFDEIGKKITDGGQKAAEQARIFAEVSRLNGLITEQERIISQLYSRIGQNYYELHKLDAEACVQAEVEGITMAEKRIEEIKAQIALVKGVESCPKCGCEIAKGTVFCPQCGERIPEISSKERSENMVNCSKCGKAVPMGQKFCIYCGSLISENDQGDTSKKICSGCGAEVEPGSKFCMKCGQMIEE